MSASSDSLPSGICLLWSAEGSSETEISEVQDWVHRTFAWSEPLQSSRQVIVTAIYQTPSMCHKYYILFWTLKMAAHRGDDHFHFLDGETDSEMKSLACGHGSGELYTWHVNQVCWFQKVGVSLLTSPEQMSVEQTCWMKSRQGPPLSQTPYSSQPSYFLGWTPHRAESRSPAWRGNVSAPCLLCPDCVTAWSLP